MSEKAVNGQAENGEGTAEKAISHEDLANAYAEMQSGVEEEEPVEEVEEPTEEPVDEPNDEPEEPEEPEEPKEDLSHGEKSRLGRKIKRLEETLSERDQRYEALLSQISEMKGMLTPQQPEPELVDDTQLLTVGDVKRLLNQQREEERIAKEQEQTRMGQYESKYKTNLVGMADTDPDMFDDLNDLLTGDTEYNRLITGDPDVDFRLNYNEAKLHLLQKKTEKVKPKLKGERATGTTVGAPDKIAPKTPASVDISKLSPEEREYLARVKARGRDPQALAAKVYSE